MSTLACTMSRCDCAERSKTGAKARHGPHHDAQKSTSTIGLSTIVCSKFSLVRLVVIELSLSNTLWCSLLGDCVGIAPCVVAADGIRHVLEAVRPQQGGGHTGPPAAGAVHDDRPIGRQQVEPGPQLGERDVHRARNPPWSISPGFRMSRRMTASSASRPSSSATVTGELFAPGLTVRQETRRPGPH